MGMNINSTYLKKENGDYNPHPRMGMNEKRPGQTMFVKYISTHIPLARTTKKSSIVYLVYGNFNSHPRMGMNLCHYIDTHQSLFQPTPPVWG